MTSRSQPNDPRSDEQLVAAANGGEAAAFDALYRRHRDWAMSLAHRFTGDHDIAADVVQETFLYLLGKFPGLELTARLRTFLYPVVRHTAVALAERRRRETAATNPDHLASEPAAARAGPHSGLAAALDALPAGQREVLFLRFAEGMSLQEVAAALQVPLGTVKSRLHLALRTLREDERTKKYLEE